MTDLPDPRQQLREGLRQLAGHAPAPRGLATAVVARHRARRRRAAGAAAAVLAIGGVLVSVPAAVSDLGSAPAVRPEPTLGTEPTPGTEAEPSLYALPVRGSLAGDEAFLAGVRSLDWGGPAGPPGGGLRPAGATRRVVYAADVPNGSRWALVLGRVGRDLVHAWFTGPAGAAPDELSLALPPARTGTAPAITLLDATDPTGWLVVVGRPGDGAEYSPSLDRDATGRLDRTYAPLPEVDGVPLGEVAPPVSSGAGQVRVRSGPGRAAQDVLVPAAVGNPPAPAAGAGDPGYWLRLRDCLVPLGFEVVLDPSGTGLTRSGGPAPAPDVGPLSSAEQAENDAAFGRCAVQAAAG